MGRCSRTVRGLLSEDCGQDLLEYALMLAVIVCGAIAGLNHLAAAIAAVPDSLLNKFMNTYNS